MPLGHRSADTRPSADERDILDDLAKPLFDAMEQTPRALRYSLGLAALAWNLSRLSEPARSDDLRVARGYLGRDDIHDLLVDLVAYAEVEWPDDPRMVAGVEVVEQPDGTFNVLAACVLRHG